MSFLTKFFKSKAEEDYETILSNLARKIEKRQIQLSEIRLRERRATLLVTLYTLAAWGAYVSLWYFSAFGGRRQNGVERALMGAPVLIGPIFILFVRRIVQVWYERKGNAEEKTLQQLLKEQRLKVEEIKKKTNYYTTRDLLQRYDDSPGAHQKGPAIPAQLGTPRRSIQASNGNSTPSLSASTSKPPTPLPPATPTRKQWYDKLADALLGDDDHSPSASTSKYALICEKCFAHNGLVKESMWADTQYLCPKCNHFNRSQNSKKQNKIIAPSPSQSSTLSSPSASRKTISPSPPVQNGATPEKPLSSERRTPPVVDSPNATMMEVDTDGS
ncbi:hypothetical protein H0H92_004567 [Tricholoma furcatifolium]|nr:hypothetical protein H0H92_004567 [Tricholoma furcatifolium]